MTRRSTASLSRDVEYILRASAGSILTEVEELLHGEGRRGELGEMLDVLGHAGQRRVLHDKPDELHCGRGGTGLPCTSAESDR